MSDLTPLRFATEYVLRNKPVIIQGKSSTRVSRVRRCDAVACAQMLSGQWPVGTGLARAWEGGQSGPGCVPALCDFLLQPLVHGHELHWHQSSGSLRFHVRSTCCAYPTCAVLCCAADAGAIDGWPALSMWDEGYLCRAMGQAPVTVDVTPNGFGDAPTRLGGWVGGAECTRTPVAPEAGGHYGRVAARGGPNPSQPMGPILRVQTRVHACAGLLLTHYLCSRIVSTG